MVIGLGYVGLPLALELSKYFIVKGFDVNKKWIQELKNNIDITNEIKIKKNFSTSKINFTHKFLECRTCNIFIITVPTPVDKKNEPDLRNLYNASDIVAKLLKKDDIVVIESTVYPGVTEKIIAPIIEKKSGMIAGKDFNMGYSPERINPGDSKHKITNIKKVVAADNKKTLNKEKF